MGYKWIALSTIDNDQERLRLISIPLLFSAAGLCPGCACNVGTGQPPTIDNDQA
jgi:hypothetical protein